MCLIQFNNNINFFTQFLRPKQLFRSATNFADLIHFGLVVTLLFWLLDNHAQNDLIFVLHDKHGIAQNDLILVLHDKHDTE